MHRRKPNGGSAFSLHTSSVLHTSGVVCSVPRASTGATGYGYGMEWLSLDPGKHGCGLACWTGDSLRSACFVAVDDSTLDGPARWYRLGVQAVDRSGPVQAAIVETMRVYANGYADPADLLDLQGVAASVCAVAAERGARPVGVLASVWKGSVPRAVLGARIEAEVARRGWADRIVPPSRATHRNDVHHAIGLGLFALKSGLITG